jgi:hypothetical protein
MGVNKYIRVFVLSVVVPVVVLFCNLVSAESQLMAADYGRIIDYEPRAGLECGADQVMVGLEVEESNFRPNLGKYLYTDVLTAFSTITPICSTLALDQYSLAFKTEKKQSTQTSVNCRDNEVVVGIRAWSNDNIIAGLGVWYNAKTDSEWDNPARRQNFSDISRTISAVQLSCAPLKIDGGDWIATGTHSKTSVLGEIYGSEVLNQDCSNPGYSSRGISISKGDVHELGADGSLLSNRLTDSKLVQLKLHCAFLYPKSVVTDADEDNDGLSNKQEALKGVSFYVQDSDQDGIPDAEEFMMDSDQDGLVDAAESALKDSDFDGVYDEQDPKNNDACFPQRDNEFCESNSITPAPTPITEPTEPTEIALPVIMNFSKRERCSLFFYEDSCSLGDKVLDSWQAHYTEKNWVGKYDLDWEDSRELGALLGNYSLCTTSHKVDRCDFKAVEKTTGKKTVRTFWDNSKATGVWGGEIKELLSKATPLDSNINSRYYSGNENWSDYMGVMYFSSKNILEAITLSKVDDSKGRTIVVEERNGKKELFIVEEDYIEDNL